MKKVNNGIVEMDWNVDGFIEKGGDLVAAVHDYNGVAVAFKDGKIYQHVENGEPLSFKDFVSTIKSCYKDGDYPYYYDDYCEIYDGVNFVDGVVDILGLGDYKEDMLNRIKDLEDYNTYEEQPIQ